MSVLPRACGVRKILTKPLLQRTLGKVESLQGALSRQGGGGYIGVEGEDFGQLAGPAVSVLECKRLVGSLKVLSLAK